MTNNILYYNFTFTTMELTNPFELLIERTLLNYIFTFIDTGSVYKSILFTCKVFNKAIKIVHPKAHINMCNHLLTLIKIYPTQNWDWYSISANPNVDWDIIINNIQYPWDWFSLSSNPNISWDIVKNNPTGFIYDPYNDTNISNRTRSKVSYKKGKVGCRSSSLGCIPNWNFDRLICNGGIPLEIIEKEKLYEKGYMKFNVLYHPNITFEGVKKWTKLFKTDFVEYLFELSSNKTITWDIINQYPEDCWDWREVSKNPNITMDIIKSNPDKDWDDYGIANNPSITIEQLKEYDKLKGYSKSLLCGRENITYKDVLENNELKWDFSSVVRSSKNITLEVIESDKRFKTPNWKCDISFNPNITWEFIVNNTENNNTQNTNDKLQKTNYLKKGKKVNFAGKISKPVAKTINNDWNFIALSDNNFNKENINELR